VNKKYVRTLCPLDSQEAVNIADRAGQNLLSDDSHTSEWYLSHVVGHI